MKRLYRDQQFKPSSVAQSSTDIVYVRSETEQNHRNKRTPHRPTLRQSGSAILTSMMYTALVMFIVISLLDFINLRSHDRAATKLSTERNQFMYWLRHEVKLGLNIYASIGLAENVELKKCVVYDEVAGDPAGQCKSTTDPSSAPRGVHLITDKGIEISGIDKDHAIKYAEDGTLCIAPTPCIFAVWTEFVATCREPGWWNCDTAKALLLSVHLSQIGGSTLLADRVEVQYVPILDWGFGQWSIIGYDSDITVPTAAVAAAAPTPAPTPTGAGVGPTPAPTPPPDPTPVPVPPPKASCGPGLSPVGDTCVRFSM